MMSDAEARVKYYVILHSMTHQGQTEAPTSFHKELPYPHIGKFCGHQINHIYDIMCVKGDKCSPQLSLRFVGRSNSYIPIGDNFDAISK